VRYGVRPDFTQEPPYTLLKHHFFFFFRCSRFFIGLIGGKAGVLGARGESAWLLHLFGALRGDWIYALLRPPLVSFLRIICALILDHPRRVSFIVSSSFSFDRLVIPARPRFPFTLFRFLLFCSPFLPGAPWLLISDPNSRHRAWVRAASLSLCSHLLAFSTIFVARPPSAVS
ncbi:unnamed protein product, partial [Phaeothamnion confervicola]